MGPVSVVLGEGGFGLLAFGLEGEDALTDEHRVDAGLDGGELAIDALVELGELAREARALVAGVAVELGASAWWVSAGPAPAARGHDRGRRGLTPARIRVQRCRG
ncbi:MAG: hypothetical protein ACRDLO_00540 [Solirubrobacterales bacterium]